MSDESPQVQVDVLTLVVRRGISRAVLFIILATSAVLASTVAAFVIEWSMKDILEQERMNGAQMAVLLETAKSTNTLALQARDVAASAVAVEESKPTIELRPTKTSTPQKPAAVIVIRPPKSQTPAASASAPAPIELPVKLPSDATTLPK